MTVADDRIVVDLKTRTHLVFHARGLRDEVGGQYYLPVELHACSMYLVWESVKDDLKKIVAVIGHALVH